VDNLNKKGMNKLVQCCYCGEKESIHHLFFECVDAKVVWSHVFEFLAFDIGADYMSVAAKWLQKENCYCVTIISATVMRGIWLIRNNFIFNN
jgi:hypothetical protein